MLSPDSPLQDLPSQAPQAPEAPQVRRSFWREGSNQETQSPALFQEASQETTLLVLLMGRGSVAHFSGFTLVGVLFCRRRLARPSRQTRIFPEQFR